MRNMTGLITAITALVFLLSTGISAAEDCECVIITHPDFVSECEILADWKNNTGISTRVADTTWINNNFEGFDGDDLQAKIKNFIYYSHDRDDTMYVILVYDEDNLIGDDLIVASIPPAGEVNASVEWYYPGSGTHNISVIVDSGHFIPETDEANNEAEKEVVVVLATIHIVDVVLALQMATGSIPTDPAADVNSDGAVTSLDALLILQYCKTQ